MSLRPAPPGTASASTLRSVEPVRQAVILAAGRGSRTGGLCADRPKALLELQGRSLLDWNLRALRDAGIQQLCIVGGWRFEALQAWHAKHVAEQADFGLSVELIEHPHWAATGPVGSLRCAETWLGRAPSLVLYGDCAYAPGTLRVALADFAGGLRVPGDRHWAALWAQRFAAPLADAERWRSAHGRLLAIGGRAESLSAESAQFMGLSVFDPAAWRRVRALFDGVPIDAFDRLDFTALFAQLLARDFVIDCMELDGGWLEVDSAADLALYAQLLATPGSLHDLRA